MADEQVVATEVVAEVVPAPATEVTATPAADVSTEPEAQPEPPKTFTQEELDAAISKRLAKGTAQVGTGASGQGARPARPAAGEQAVAREEPDVMVLAERIANQREQAKAVAKVVEAYHEREEKHGRSTTTSNKSPTTPSCQSPKRWPRPSRVRHRPRHHLLPRPNPKEAEAHLLVPLSQAKEIGKLEAKLAANPPAKRTSTAPAPISPVAARRRSAAYDTTDPRSCDVHERVDRSERAADEEAGTRNLR